MPKITVRYEDGGTLIFVPDARRRFFDEEDALKLAEIWEKAAPALWRTSSCTSSPSSGMSRVGRRQSTSASSPPGASRCRMARSVASS